MYSIDPPFVDSIKLPVQPHSESSSTSSRQKKSKNAKKNKLKSLGTDENITVLHALGRVFNPKCKYHANLILSSPHIKPLSGFFPRAYVTYRTFL